MQKQLQKRLEELKTEFEKGQQKLQELEAETANLRNTLLRISGAIQVLEEMSAEKKPENENGNGEQEEALVSTAAEKEPKG